MNNGEWDSEVLGNPMTECICGHVRSEHGYILGAKGKGKCTQFHCHCNRFIAKGKNHEHKFEPV